MEFSKIEIYTEEKDKKGIIKYMLPLSVDSPRFKELEGIYDGGKHEKIILISRSINEGLAVAARILNSCLGGNDDEVCDHDDIDSLLNDIDELDDIDPILGADNEEAEDGEMLEDVINEKGFLIYQESDISVDCNNVGADVSNYRSKDIPQYDVSGCGKLIVVCNGVFALSDKLMSQLKANAGNVIVIIPKNRVNSEKVNDLIFEGFQCFEVPARTKEYYADLLMQYVESQGYVCFANASAIVSNLMEHRNNKFREYDIKIICDRAIERAGADAFNLVDDTHFSMESYNPDTTSGDEMLKKIIGLEKSKELIKKECAMAVQNRRMAELTGSHDATYKSICFMGNAGTGKTTLARAVSKIYADNGITNGVFMEVSRADFVSPWIGETSLRVAKIFQQADGGVIFIDEAGSLCTSDMDKGGVEALGAIVRHMDVNPQTIVILATYPDEMERLFEINQGLKSRISNIIPFENYDTEELVSIFKMMARTKCYKLPTRYRTVIEPYFDKVRKNDSFGNGRDVRKLIESAIGIMAVHSGETFSTKLTLSSIRQAVNEALENQTDGKNPIGFRQE